MNRKSYAYIYFLLVWTLILLCAGSFGLYKLNDFLGVYEQCELAPVKAAFEERFGEDNIGAVIDSYIASLNANLHTDAEYRELILSQMRGSMQLEKLTGQSGVSRAVYRISVNGTAVGTVSFEKDVPMPYGLFAWRCAKESYSFAYLEETDSIEVPESYTVKVNGYVLDESYVVSRRPIEGYGNVLRYLKGSVRELCTYSVSSMGGQSFEVFDELGREVALSELSTGRFMNNCSPEQVSAVRALSSDFIKLYTAYSAGINYQYYFGRLADICMPGSDIMARLGASLEGYAYSMRRPAEIKSLEIYRISAASENEFICDVRYTVDANAYTEIISTDYDVRLVVEYSGGRYLVSVLTSN